MTSALLLFTFAIALPQAPPPGCPRPSTPPTALPEAAAEKLRESVADARPHDRHGWRDTAPLNDDGTVNVYVEIARGSSEKWEFDMEKNRRELNRMVPASLGGYPTGYGFIPRTVGTDGDPFDGLVLGGTPAGGVLVRGHVLGIMHMTDEKGPDAKIVVTAEPNPVLRAAMLDAAEKARIAHFFNRYKAADDDAESFACVSGWGDAAEARRWLARAVELAAPALGGR